MNAHEQYVRIAGIDRYWVEELRSSNQHAAADEREKHAEEMERMAEATANAINLPMPTHEKVYSFIRDEYLNSRFEGMNAAWPKGVPSGGTYSDCVVRSCIADLERDGVSVISHFESRRGKPVVFNRALQILNEDAPTVEIRHKAAGSGNW